MFSARRLRFAAILVFAFVVWGVFYVWSAGGARFFVNYHRVAVGDTEAKVVMLLGNPDAKDIIFRLGQEKGYESEYLRAKVSQSQYYLFWEKGVDVVYAVGFDSNHRVTIKAYGGT
jgi:hypothetical protein